MNRTGSTGGDGSVSTSTGSVSPPRRSSGQRAGRRARCHRRTSSVGSATEGSPTGDGGCVGGTSTQVRPLATSCLVPRPSSGHVSPTSGSTGHFESPPARAEVKSLLRNGADIGSALHHQEGSTRPRRRHEVDARRLGDGVGRGWVTLPPRLIGSGAHCHFPGTSTPTSHAATRTNSNLPNHLDAVRDLVRERRRRRR
jgi:hypothetical protein